MISKDKSQVVIQSYDANSEFVSHLSCEAVAEISSALRLLLADVFTLYLKTNAFHWHMKGRHFRDYHLLLDEHAEQILAMSDTIAERARKLGGTTLWSISEVLRYQRLQDSNAMKIAAGEMLRELRADNVKFIQYLRSTHGICSRRCDVATASLLEAWIDETERRTWFLSETVSNSD